MKTRMYAFVLISWFALANAKTLPFKINNESTCTFTQVFFAEQTAKLSLPKEIAPNQTSPGSVSFDSGLFSGIKQWGSAQYIAECDYGRFAFAIRFYMGKDHVDDIGFFIDIGHAEQAPFVVLPFRKTMIKLDDDYIISIFNKEVKHESAKQDDNNHISPSIPLDCYPPVDYKY